MIDFAYQDGDSFLHRLDPAIKFVCMIALAGLILLLNNRTGIIVSAAVIIILFILSKLSIESVLKPLKRLIGFLVLIFLMNSLFSEDNSCIYKAWIICISRTGITRGFNIVLHTLSISILSSFFIRTTTSIEIMKGMETIMKPLKIFGIPTRDIALIMSIALQFIPVFFSDIDRIRKAQIARGADFNSGTFIDKIKAVYPLVIPAFISAFRRADDLALAIDARGFQSEKETIRK